MKRVGATELHGANIKQKSCISHEKVLEWFQIDVAPRLAWVSSYWFQEAREDP